MRKCWRTSKPFKSALYIACKHVNVLSTEYARSPSSRTHACMCRLEVRFSGMEELIARIKSSIGISKAQLDMPEHAQVRQHTVLSIA